MTPEILARTAQIADSNGQHEKAWFLYHQAINLDPDHLGALLGLGSLAARRGNLTEAERFLKRVLVRDPDSFDATRWLTTLLIGRDGGAEAVEFGRRAVSLRPSEAETYVILGLAAMGHGDSALAIESFERAIAIDPNLAGAFHNLGVSFQREERFEEATVAFARAAKLAPTSVETMIHLGQCYLARDLGDEALECAERALVLSPDLAAAKRLRAEAKFVAFQGDRGLEHIRKAMESDPSAAFPAALMGSRLQEQGDFADAEVFVKRSIDLQPAQGFAYYLLAHNRRIQEDDRPMVQRMEEIGRHSALELEDRQYLHFGLGKAYDDLHEFEAAIRHFDLAHETGEPIPTMNLYASWVRRLVHLFSSDVLSQFADMGLDTDEPIFIFGMPRSGTTLLEQIVSRHSTVGAAGELFFWRDSCRRIVHLREGGFNPTELAKAGQQYLHLLRSKAPGKAHVTDKFPSNFAYLGLLRLVFPRATFIHARRNPLDTSLSIYMRPFSTNQGLGRTRREIVDTYQLYRDSMRHWRSVLGSEQLLEVDYEELVQDLEPMIRRIVAHCGLTWEDACLVPQESDRRVVTFSKWQVRQPVYTTSVERWRNYERWLGVFRELMDDESHQP